MTYALHHGDCLEVLATLPDCSVDAIVTDPPAGIAFMGKVWDRDKGGKAEWVQWMQSVATQCRRVIKPGGHALVWAIPRTSHWTGDAWEEAGWQVRDKIYHVFGSGFPKSLDVSKAIDKAAGAEREVVGVSPHSANRKAGAIWGGTESEPERSITAPATPAAKQWAGWGTALKPAAEEWWLFRRPLEGTVAANVLKHGTGAINVDGCRVGNTVETWPQSRSYAPGQMQPGHTGSTQGTGEPPPGRWPANFTHDGSDEVTALLGDAARFFYSPKASKADRDEGCELYESWLDSLELILDNDDFINLKELSIWENVDQKVSAVWSGEVSRLRVTFEDIATSKNDSVLSMLLFGNGFTERSLTGIRFTTSTGTSKTIDLKTLNWLMRLPTSEYTEDALKTMQEIGLSRVESAALQNLLKATSTSGTTACLLGASNAAKKTLQPINAKEWLQGKTRGNIHSTVKPVDLMTYLCRLITPPGGTILDPFTGSGSTGKAAILEDFKFIGIEREAEYIEIARARIDAAINFRSEFLF